MRKKKCSNVDEYKSGGINFTNWIGRAGKAMVEEKNRRNHVTAWGEYFEYTLKIRGKTD